jgi:hypothetical protein
LTGPDRKQVQFFGVYLICVGGYHRWPCLISPVKTGVAGSPVMKWSAKLESVRKDIEGVFGILKKRFRFLKNFNNLFHQSDIDNAFVTCCMLHNMLSKYDGWLAPDLAQYPGGVEATLFKKFGNIYANPWNGTAFAWNHVEDDTIDEALERENNQPIHLANKARTWAKVMKALVKHHRFGGNN